VLAGHGVGTRSTGGVALSNASKTRLTELYSSADQRGVSAICQMAETLPYIKPLCRPAGHDLELIYLQYLGLKRGGLNDMLAH